MKVACVIPARFASSRFPGKLLVKVRGKTVLQRTFESVSQCKELDALYVATDDERIAEHVRSMGSEPIWTSPACKNGTERILEACQNDPVLQDTDILINVQADHPCTSSETIRAMLDRLQKVP